MAIKWNKVTLPRLFRSLRRYGTSCWVPVWTAGALLVLAFLFYRAIGVAGVPSSDTCTEWTNAHTYSEGSVLTVREITNRYLFGLSALGFAALSLGTAILAWGLYTKANRVWGIGGAVLAATPAFIAFFRSPSFKPFVLGELYLCPSVYRVAPAMHYVSKALDVSCVIGLLSVALAVVALLHPPGAFATVTLTSEDKVRYWAARIRWVRMLLIGSAVALAAGVVQVGALYRWAASLLTLYPGDLLASYIAITRLPLDVKTFVSGVGETPQAAALLLGSFYSLLLTSLFVPALLILQSIARDLALSSCGPEASASDRDKWLASQALSLSVPARIGVLASLIAPVLAEVPGKLLVDLVGRF